MGEFTFRFPPPPPGFVLADFDPRGMDFMIELKQLFEKYGVCLAPTLTSVDLREGKSVTTTVTFTHYALEIVPWEGEIKAYYNRTIIQDDSGENTPAG